MTPKKRARPPSNLVTKFFELTLDKQFTNAEKILNEIKLKIRLADWSLGYLHALEGIIYVRRTDYDKYAFLSNIDFDDPNELKRIYKEFQKHSNDRMHTVFDRGFFSAWADFIKYLIENRRSNK